MYIENRVFKFCHMCACVRPRQIDVCKCNLTKILLHLFWTFWYVVVHMCGTFYVSRYDCCVDCREEIHSGTHKSTKTDGWRQHFPSPSSFDTVICFSLHGHSNALFFTYFLSIQSRGLIVLLLHRNVAISQPYLNVNQNGRPPARPNPVCVHSVGFV